MILRVGGVRYVLFSKPEQNGKSLPRLGTVLRLPIKPPTSALMLCYSI